jgi:hypothetical protein
MQITQLPTNMLLNPSRRVQAINIYGEELSKKVGDLTKVKIDKKNKKTPENIRTIKKG